jgi:predicted nucleic acid-binding protein
MARGRNLKFLLDTNIISELRKRERANPNVTRWIEQTPFKEIGTSVLVLAEIRRGIELKRRHDSAQAELLERWFVQMRTRLGTRVLPIDEPIADAWAMLSVPDPVPFIDGLLAATAKVHGLALVTRNADGIARTGARVLNPFDP